MAKYLPRLTDSEIFVILVSGMGSMSASILGGYSALGIPMSTLLIASALVPIGSIMVSKIVCPQTEEVLSAYFPDMGQYELTGKRAYIVCCFTRRDGLKKIRDAPATLRVPAKRAV